MRVAALVIGAAAHRPGQRLTACYVRRCASALRGRCTASRTCSLRRSHGGSGSTRAWCAPGAARHARRGFGLGAGQALRRPASRCGSLRGRGWRSAQRGIGAHVARASGGDLLRRRRRPAAGPRARSRQPAGARGRGGRTARHPALFSATGGRKSHGHAGRGRICRTLARRSVRADSRRRSEPSEPEQLDPPSDRRTDRFLRRARDLGAARPGRLALALLLLVAAPLGLRGSFVDHGMPRGYVPDVHIVRNALGMARDKNPVAAARRVLDVPQPAAVHAHPDLRRLLRLRLVDRALEQHPGVRRPRSSSIPRSRT